MERLKRIRYLVFHHTASPETATVDDVRRWHLERGFRDIGYHFLIRHEGDRLVLYPGRPPYLVGAHARGVNHESIGVAYIGNFDIRRPTDWHYREIAQKIKEVMIRLNLQNVEVIGHREVYTKLGRRGGTSCPGKFFDMNRLRAEISALK